MPWWDGLNEAEDLPWAVGQIKERFGWYRDEEETFCREEDDRSTRTAWEERYKSLTIRELRALCAARGVQKRSPSKAALRWHLAQQDRADGKELPPEARAALQVQLRRNALIMFLVDTLADTLEPFLLEEGARRLAALRVPHEDHENHEDHEDC